MFDFPMMNGSSVPEDDEMLDIGGAVESEVEREGVKLREDLKFYFMSPCDKYRARRQIPWKLALQVLKIVMVTTQLILFGLSNQLVVSFKEENTMAFKHLFLKGYTGTDEDDYSRTVYTQRDLYDSIFYVIDQYRQIGNLSLGTVSYENEEKRKGLKICKQHYHRGLIHPSNDTFYIDPTVDTECLHLEPELLAHSPPRDPAINSSFFNLEFYRLIKVEISFRLKGIDLQTIRVRELPDCYVFHNKITFNNQAHSGKVKIFFESDATIQDCKDWQISGSIQKNTHYILVFDGFVILTCLTSLILCSRSIVLAIKLQRPRGHGWYYTTPPIQINRRQLISGGAGCRTLTTSLMSPIEDPNVGRYVCICGPLSPDDDAVRGVSCPLESSMMTWASLLQFEDLNTVAECLFSLVNGDDMFATFAQIQQKSTMVWLFSRLYLYSFMSLFIYMILSLFIALITDSYETIKNYQQNGFPTTDLHKFLCGVDVVSETQNCEKRWLDAVPVICCCIRSRADDDSVLID
ncbi:mucolipin-2 [Phyllobates terribilis]|uniref:mucolipin-2 n=1 Tax=Phyllobates terribilis TaxID=111132 RepID=UPI003CCAD9E4